MQHDTLRDRVRRESRSGREGLHEAVEHLLSEAIAETPANSRIRVNPLRVYGGPDMVLDIQGQPVFVEVKVSVEPSLLPPSDYVSIRSQVDQARQTRNNPYSLVMVTNYELSEPLEVGLAEKGIRILKVSLDQAWAEVVSNLRRLLETLPPSEKQIAEAAQRLA